MFPSKKNILQVVALLKAYEIKHIVLSPGSRNAPLIQAFTQESYFNCHLIVDERNAAFYALGIIQCVKESVVICCTSGTALLDYAPAVAEAYYQQLPLIILSADRPQEWIGQMDGQTIHQPNVFKNYIKKSVNLPEIHNDTEEWYCNRLINEALIVNTANYPGPVQINIPLSEPLFDYSITKLPSVRKITFSPAQKFLNIEPFTDIWNRARRKMIIVGQLFPDPQTADLLKELQSKSNCVILSEHLANCNNPLFIHNFDSILAENTSTKLAPDLLVTFGGHITSKRIKKFIRENKPTYHWHLSQDAEVVDLFQSLTNLIETDTSDFLRKLVNKIETNNDKCFSDLWQSESAKRTAPLDENSFSGIYVCGQFFNVLPQKSKLILANSSSLRYAQVFTLHESIEIYCNRGTNGIEGSLSSAIGFASVCKEPVYLIIGDLSFFYNANALWNINHINNLRILLINNKGGQIFKTIPGLNKSESLNKYVSASHQISAKKWVEAGELQYLHATNKDELENNLKLFMNERTKKSVVLEILL